MNKLLSWFLYTRIGQWIGSVVSGGWCYIAKDDERFVVSVDANCLPYQGEPSYAPSKIGPSTQRKSWHTFVIFKIQEATVPRFVAIDTVFGQRLACIGKKVQKGVFAIKVGHEPATILLGVDARYHLVHQPLLRPEFLVRWKESDPWPLDVAKEQVLFI